MLQVIKEIERNPEDKTQVTFVYANQSVDDIILKEELDQIASKNDNIKVCASVDRLFWIWWSSKCAQDSTSCSTPPEASYQDHDSEILIRE